MSSRAADLFDVSFETRRMSVGSRVAKGAVRVTMGVLLEGDPEFDTSAKHFHILIRDRSTGNVLRDQNWGSDEQSARASLVEIKKDLARLDVDAFLDEYTIRMPDQA